ncbi:hypothetical protein QBC38DRAFT_255744 [Podospora fimiseda]|uniref:Uncharacterized protein n=1 Tax=Podospora fimiseda TaxID=252190 RepID=A0AAN7BLQ5_9PEZI|nr:hypothetical protein QBC38DRAFT_255744 [Podospora fimiseda]
MCTQIRLLLLCPCPSRDTPSCPHHKNLLPPLSKPTETGITGNCVKTWTNEEGYKLRLPTVLQSNVNWIEYKWQHCSGYKMRYYHHTTHVAIGKETMCPLTGKEKGWTKVVKRVCEDCVEGKCNGVVVTEESRKRRADDDVRLESTGRKRVTFGKGTGCREGNVGGVRGDSSWITTKRGERKSGHCGREMERERYSGIMTRSGSGNGNGYLLKGGGRGCIGRRY